MNIKRIDDKEFLLLKEEWNGLLSRSSSDNVFLRWEWIHTWWEVFHKKRTLFVLTIREENRLVGIAPFYIEPAAFPKARCLRFCSDELAPDYMDVIIEKGLETPVMQEIARYIKQHAGEWDILVLDCLIADSTLLSHPSCFEGLFRATKNSLGCPYIVLAGSFDDYIRSRTMLPKLALPRKIKNLFGKNTVRHVLLENPTDLSKGLDDLFRLHKMRADNMGMRSNFASAEVERFHWKLAGLFLEQGILKLYLLYDGDMPVNAHYTFCYGNKIYSFQRGLNPLYKKWSAGSLCLYLEIKSAFAEGRTEFDLLKGEDAYKFLWTNLVRRQFLLTVYSPTRCGAFWYATDRLIAALKRVKAALRNRTHASSSSD